MTSATKQRQPEICEFMPADYFARLDTKDIFADGKPLEVDLGTGDGTFLIKMAQHYTDHNFLGVERLLGRVKKVCRKARNNELTNCKVLRLESKYVVEWLLPEESVDRMHLLCPDPWPKERHHKRRLVQQEFLEAVFRALKPGGEFCFKTDHPEYFDWVVDEINTFGKFQQLDWPEDAFYYPKTDFQVQWEAEGKTLQRIRVQKP
ncbi:tRNA (guanine-N7-)-methyltransferase [Rubritalea squalenifaciens DSM 18772]|uniref:tRNA (guanine-N(7)-)-methyltransferase n=2 Tax=Rubritalea TaxID=361050 RepID=A0A1M6RZD5_9BACT|nr:tRNA (guanosine(46)-N7)-methyltransferase TrmB [Rubritalea squalenifaciens]SHK37835.1 tRNA (guanine-N7-)-methyltransferase [Rubritalea squalenifaciens DSM 18772]